MWNIQRLASQNPGQKGAQKCPTVGSLSPRLPGFPDIELASSCFWRLRASLFDSGFDIDLRVIGLLKTVTFAGAVTFSGAETEEIAQWAKLVGAGS